MSAYFMVQNKAALSETNKCKAQFTSEQFQEPFAFFQLFWTLVPVLSGRICQAGILPAFEFQGAGNDQMPVTLARGFVCRAF
jgi:hypothetical protein